MRVEPTQLVRGTPSNRIPKDCFVGVQNGELLQKFFRFAQSIRLLEDAVAANRPGYDCDELDDRLMRKAHRILGSRWRSYASPEIGYRNDTPGYWCQRARPRRYRSSRVQPLSRGCCVFRADVRLRCRSVAWSNKRSRHSRFSSAGRLPGGITRITSPAATQSISSPGRILYRSAIFLGTVT
jgi:hypothetical protein